MPRTSNKRERLIDSARRLIHYKGYKQTTLADIAREANVPLGNVYYYFKTKDAIASAVLDERIHNFENSMESWKEMPDPRARLLALVEHLPTPDRNVIARYGCPIGSLCQELDKERTPLALKADGIVKLQLQWATEQFRQLGKDDATDLALQLIASLQGIHMLANTLSDGAVVDSQISRLRQWLETL